MKKLITSCLVMAVATSLASAGITNGGFETDLTGWTTDYTNDGSNNGYTNNAQVTNNFYYSGQNALLGYAEIVGDYNPNWTPENLQEDWARTYVWSDYQNLSNVTSIQLYLTNFISSDNHYGWGWGQEVFLILDDGTNRASALLIDNHEPGYTSLVDLGSYILSIGDDENTWYGFDVPISGFPGINLSNAKVGICWEAISWHYNTQTLFAGAAVDDITLVPEPATMVLLGLGGLLLRKKHSKA